MARKFDLSDSSTLPRRGGKALLAAVALLGLIGGAILFLPIASNQVAQQTIVVRHSLQYQYADPPALALASQAVWHLFYLAIVSMPLVVVRNRTMLWFSTALVISAIISHVFFLYAFASIWCFCAAFLSLFLGYLFHGLPVRQPTPGPESESGAAVG